MKSVIVASFALTLGAIFYSRPDDVETVRRLLTAAVADKTVPEDTADTTQRELAYPPPLTFVGKDHSWGPHPLNVCEGDCDSDNDCAGNLKCFQRKKGDTRPVPGCAGTPTHGTDYCFGSGGYAPPPPPTYHPPPPPPPPYPSGGGTLVHKGNNGNPPGAFPLHACEGDCDRDQDCAGYLKCFKRGGSGHPPGSAVPGCHGYGSNPEEDFCYDPNSGYPPPPYPKPTPYPYPKPTPYPQPTGGGGYLAEVGNNGRPPHVFPLGKCQGDCDNDRECQYGLTCFQRKKDEAVPGCYGWARSGIDFCIGGSKPKPKPTPYPYYPKPTPYPYYPKPTPYPYYPKPTPKPTPYYTHTQEPSMTDVPTKSGGNWYFHE